MSESEEALKAKHAQEFFDQLRDMEKRSGLTRAESNGLMLAYGMLIAIANPIDAQREVK